MKTSHIESVLIALIVMLTVLSICLPKKFTQKFALPARPMFYWTVGISVGHRLLCIGLCLLGFFTGLAGNGAGGTDIMKVGVFLDYPVAYLYGRTNLEDYGMPMMPFDSILQPLWSLALGFILAAFICMGEPNDSSIPPDQ